MTYARDLAKKLKGMKATGRLAPEIANEALAALQCGDECGCTHICRCSVARQVEMSVVDEASGAAQAEHPEAENIILDALKQVAADRHSSLTELAEATAARLAALAGLTPPPDGEETRSNGN